MIYILKTFVTLLKLTECCLILNIESIILFPNSNYTEFGTIQFIYGKK